MKKIGLMVVAVSLSLSVAAFAVDQPKTERSASRSKTEQPKNQKTPREGKAVRGAESAKALNSQIAQLKQEHQTAINELEELKRLASEEKATKTLGAVEKLIARRNQEFQQRLKRLEAQMKSGDETKNGNAPKTENKSKNKSTPKL